MAQETQERQPLTVLARQIGALKHVEKVPLGRWQAMTNAQKGEIIMTALATLVAQCEGEHPGCLYAFLPYRVEADGKFVLGENNVLAQMVTITVAAGVFQPVEEQEPEPEAPDTEEP